MEKNKRLRSNRDFKKVYKIGKVYYNRNFTIIVKKNKLQGSRVGFSITKKHGNAVKRNKLKRRLKEITRHNIHLINDGYDLIIIPKQNTKNLKYKELEKSAIHLLKIVFKR